MASHNHTDARETGGPVAGRPNRTDRGLPAHRPHHGTEWSGHDHASDHYRAGTAAHQHDASVHRHDASVHRHDATVHRHGPAHGAERRLRLALGLTTLILAVEVVGGLLSHSLALLADAGHMLTDVGALALALFAAHQAHRPANQARTYGYHRVGIVVALVNASALIAIAMVIAVQAYGRLMHPAAVQPTLMIVAAALGLAINLFIAARLHDHGLSDLNMRGAWLHVMGDAGASAGVIVAAVLIKFTGWLPLDPLLSVAIALLIAVGAWRILSDALAVLLEAVPREIDMPEMVRQMLGVSGVRDVHDLHVWSIGSGLTMLSCHVRIDDQSLAQGLHVVERVSQMLRDRFGIAHCTIQPETSGCVATDLYCALPCSCCQDGQTRAASNHQPADAAGHAAR